MVKGKQQSTNTATEMREMRALIERLFGELNARLDKFDQAILQLKESIESSKGGKAVESALNASSDGHGNSSMVQVFSRVGFPFEVILIGLCSIVSDFFFENVGDRKSPNRYWM